MPPRNAPLPNAVNLFNCDICDKGYPRQIDYENHLRSYDHNHRRNLADMKKTTASRDNERSQPNKGTLDMRSIPMGDAGKSAGLGPRFKKVGGGAMMGGAAAAGGRFKKVGVAVGGSKEGLKPKKDGGQQEGEVIQERKIGIENMLASEPDAERTVIHAELEEKPEFNKVEDVVMNEAEEEENITWDEYDFSNPTGCDHANCPGCKSTMRGTYEDGWLVIEAA